MAHSNAICSRGPIIILIMNAELGTQAEAYSRMFGIFKSGNRVTRPVFNLQAHIFAAEMTGALVMHLQFACVWQEIDKTEIWGSLNVPLWSERGTHAFAEKNNNKRREKTRVSLETVEFLAGVETA